MRDFLKKYVSFFEKNLVIKDKKALTNFLLKVIVYINQDKDPELAEKLHKLAANYNPAKKAFFNPKAIDLQKFVREFRF